MFIGMPALLLTRGGRNSGTSGGVPIPVPDDNASNFAYYVDWTAGPDTTLTPDGDYMRCVADTAGSPNPRMWKQIDNLLIGEQYEIFANFDAATAGLLFIRYETALPLDGGPDAFVNFSDTGGVGSFTHRMMKATTNTVYCGIVPVVDTIGKYARFQDKFIFRRPNYTRNVLNVPADIDSGYDTSSITNAPQDLGTGWYRFSTNGTAWDGTFGSGKTGLWSIFTDDVIYQQPYQISFNYRMSAACRTMVNIVGTKDTNKVFAGARWSEATINNETGGELEGTFVANAVAQDTRGLIGADFFGAQNTTYADGEIYVDIELSSLKMILQYNDAL